MTRMLRRHFQTSAYGYRRSRKTVRPSAEAIFLFREFEAQVETRKLSDIRMRWP
ncbi:Uncharacterised protein [Escherichia coli]|nr:Uncharacterised protein [Escherichia coli]